MARKIKAPVIVAKLSFGPCRDSGPKLWTTACRVGSGLKAARHAPMCPSLRAGPI
jgi:hypothetical protein